MVGAASANEGTFFSLNPSVTGDLPRLRQPGVTIGSCTHLGPTSRTAGLPCSALSENHARQGSKEEQGGSDELKAFHSDLT
ncbi:MAG TPA: hypothetical protein DCY79_03745 [Planctomycetaceae bacterium]|nr:hypothetical protein [Planctomycetaceae bacterium]